MHSSLDAPYTNEISQESLRHLDDLYLEPRQLEGYGEDVAAFVSRQKAFVEAHPPIAIYRVATEAARRVTAERSSKCHRR